MILVLIAPAVVLKQRAAIALIPQILTLMLLTADRTNLSTDGTENTDRGIDDTGGISSMSTYAL